MRKKFFAMYALVGALVASPVFTSCIDGEESESVTAVRNERAAAIKAKIAMEQAEADRKAQLEELKLAMDMANYEQQKAMYEKNLLDYQLQIEKAKAELKAYQETTLSELTDAYTNALSNVAAAEWNVVKYNQQIANINADYTNALETLKEDIAEQNESIAEYQAKIEKLKKLQEEGVDAAALVATKKELKAIQDKAFKDYKELQLQYGIDNSLIQNAHNIDNAKSLEVIKAIDFFKNPDGDNTTSDALSVTKKDAEDLYILTESAVLKAQRDYANELTDEEHKLAQAIAALGTEADKVGATYDQKTTPSATAVKTLTVYAQSAIANEFLKTLEKALADAEKALADNTDASLKDGLEQDVKDAKEDIADFKANNTNNAGTLTVGEGANAVPYTVWGPLYVEMKILEAKDKITDAEIALEKAKKESKAFEEHLKAFEGEAYEAYKTAVAELDAAKETYSTAKAEYDAVVALYTNIDTTESGVTNKTFDEAIALYQTKIEEINAEIKELSASFESFSEDLLVYNNDHNYWYVDTISVTVNSEEVLAGTIAYLEKKVAIEEAKLVALNKVLEEAKAALDAYLAE